MRIGPVSMVDFESEEELEKFVVDYDKVRADAFPTMQLVATIRTSPKSLLSVALYPNYESAASNLAARDKFQDQLPLKDTFFHEGELIYYYQSAFKPATENC